MTAPPRIIAASTTSGLMASRVYPVTAPTAAGETLLVIATANAQVAPGPVIDSAGNAYTEDSRFTTLPFFVAYRCPGATGGPGGGPSAALTTSDTFTLTTLASPTAVCSLYVLAAMLGHLDSTQLAQTGNSTALQSTITPTLAAESVIGASINQPAGGQPTVDPPFTQIPPVTAQQIHTAGHYMDAPGGTPITFRVSIPTAANLRFQLWAFLPLPGEAGLPLRVWDGEDWRLVSAASAQVWDGSDWQALQ